MPALVFPPTPAAGDIHDENGRKWRSASKGVWESYPLASGSAPGTPDAPTLVEATTTTLEVEVDAVSGATGYKWYLDTVFVASTSDPTYTFTGLTENTEYDITVSATNAYGESAQSAALVESTDSGAGITFVAATSDNQGLSRSWTINKPTVLEGDILIAILTSDSNHNTDGTPPTGWTKIVQRNASTDSTTSVFWKRAGASESGSDTWTNIFASMVTGISVCLAYRGATVSGDPTEGLNSAEISFGSTSTIDCTTVTNNALVLGIFATDPNENPRTTAWTSPIVKRIDSDTTPSGQNAILAYITVGDIIKETAGVQTMSATVTADSWAQITFALKP